MTSDAVLELVDAELTFGQRSVWADLNIAVSAGEFVAVLGANGSGKSSLLKAVLALIPLAHGTIDVVGSPARRGRRDIGYMPQQRGYRANVPLRGRDLVRLGVDGHRYGLGGARRSSELVDALIHEVGADSFANQPLGRLSGGEQQRLRVAQALASDPRLLLCDEPLQSLDLASQRRVVELIDRQRHTSNTAVLFVTHEINPVLSVVDRVLYLMNGTFRLGPVSDVMTTAVLSELYQSDVEVIRRGDRLIVIGGEDTPGTLAHHEHSP